MIKVLNPRENQGQGRNALTIHWSNAYDILDIADASVFSMGITQSDTQASVFSRGITQSDTQGNYLLCYWGTFMPHIQKQSGRKWAWGELTTTRETNRSIASRQRFWHTLKFLLISEVNTILKYREKRTKLEMGARGLKSGNIFLITVWCFLQKLWTWSPKHTLCAFHD